MTNAEADNGTAVVAVAFSLLTLSSIVIALRLWVRQTRVSGLRIDDYLVITAWTCCVLQVAFYTVAWTHGLGRHFDTLTANQQRETLKWMIVVAQPFTILTSLFGRLSFCATLLAILGYGDSKRKTVLWAIVAVQLIINIIVVVQILAQCGVQIEALYDPAVAAHASCQSHSVQTIIGYVQGSINSACDLTLAIMPVLILWSLNMPLSQKIGVGAMLTLSVFACIASTTKTVLLRTLLKGDITWFINNLNLAALVENNVVMIAASIPMLRPLIHKPENGSSALRPHRSSAYDWPPRGPHVGSYNPRVTGGTTSEPYLGDGDSEEYILQSPGPKEGQIKKTMEVTLETLHLEDT